MSDQSDALGISDAILELRRRYGKSVGYQALWRRIREESIPATKVNGDWRINLADLPRIAAIFKLDRAA